MPEPLPPDGNDAAEAGDAASLVPLLEPADGVPAVTDSPRALSEAAERLAAGHGPVAVDAERASGYRYSQRAYLIQLKRAGAGIVLIDPIACGEMSELQRAIGGSEWVLHAASQDLPCLHEVGLAPASLFDTELASRLLGYPRVGLAAVVGRTLGYGLAKEHSAVDWSTRPLDPSWLTYAALDVEVLLDVRDLLEQELTRSGKLEWARQEFEAERLAPPPSPKPEPWRHISGLHQIKDRRHLAIARELWSERDRRAQARDIAQGRVLPDDALVRAAEIAPRTAEELSRIRPFGKPFRRGDLSGYVAAIQRGLAADESGRPPVRAARVDGPPPPRLWRDRNPQADARLKAARAALAALSEEIAVPVENIVSPAIVRQVCWEPPAIISPESVAGVLLDLGARPWQAGLAGPVIAHSFTL